MLASTQRSPRLKSNCSKGIGAGTAARRASSAASASFRFKVSGFRFSPPIVGEGPGVGSLETWNLELETCCSIAAALETTSPLINFALISHSPFRGFQNTSPSSSLIISSAVIPASPAINCITGFPYSFRLWHSASWAVTVPVCSSVENATGLRKMSLFSHPPSLPFTSSPSSSFATRLTVPMFF